MSPRLDTINGNHFKHTPLIVKSKENITDAQRVERAVDSIIKENAELLVDVTYGRREKKELESMINEYFSKQKMPIEQYKTLIQGVLNYLYKYGRLQSLIDDETISDIDFTKYDHGVIKRNGIKEKIDKKFTFETEDAFKRFATTLIVRNRGIINENFSHERVSDENHRLRINVSIPPRNLNYTSMNIRKHRQNPYSLEALLELNMFDRHQYRFFIDMVKNKKKFLLCGQGAAGKTTLLRALLMKTDLLDTFLIMEKDTELYLSQGNFIQQRIKKDHHGGVKTTLGDLVKDGLTMSLDGYVVGEIVGDEAWHFINAGVTDHMIAGSIHAESAKDVPNRLLSMVETFNPGPKAETVLGLIARSLDYVVHLKDFKVDEIAQICDYNHQHHRVDVKSVILE